MKVYIVFVETKYEGRYVYEIFDSEEKANICITNKTKELDEFVKIRPVDIYSEESYDWTEEEEEKNQVLHNNWVNTNKELYFFYQDFDCFSIKEFIVN